jgi:hypothetical protein
MILADHRIAWGADVLILGDLCGRLDHRLRFRRTEKL